MKALTGFGRRWVYDNSLPLEVRKLNIACLFGFFSCLIAVVARVIEQAGILPIIIVIVMAVLVAVLFFVANYCGLIRVGTFCMVWGLSNVMFPALFLTNGGMDSALNCYFVLCLVLCFILVNGWMRVLCLASLSVTVIFLYTNSVLDTPIIPIIPEGGLTLYQQLIDNFQSIFVAGLFIGLVVVFQHGLYEEERSRADVAIENLTQAREEALASSQAKGDFLANMSHEIRTPMNAIIGMTELARSSDDPQRTEHYLEKVHEASSHLLGVINDILDMSKIEANKMVFNEQPFSFVAMVDRAVSIVSFRIAEREQHFTLDLSCDIPEVLIGDDQRLTQVITNLIGNAIKFTPDGGSISLVAKLIKIEGNIADVCVEISDTGIGITEDQRSRLFSSFEQADSSTSRKFGGTGLGLAISKRIVEMAGGSIEVDSIPDQGSTFRFNVQLAISTESVAALGNRATGEKESVLESFMQADFSAGILLVAEDNEVNREILAAMLEPTGITIDFAVDGLEAVRAFEAAPERYNLVFMDLQMPHMNGFDATEHIRAMDHPRARTIPIVAMTANVFQEDIDRCMACGMNDHLGKPLNLTALLKSLDHYLG